MGTAAAPGKGATIWIQSCSAESDAAIWSTYQESIRRHARRVVSPAREVEFHGLSTTFPGIDYVDSAAHLATFEVVRNAIRAEDAGYAAFCFISTNDAGNREVRELTDLPTAFVVESAVQMAAQLGGKFAFLTHNAGSRRKMEQLTADRFRLGEMLVEGASLALTYQDFMAIYRDPKPVLARFVQEARGAIARGARVLIPAGGPLNQFFVDQGFTDVDGVPLIDIMAVVMKEAERMADLKALGAPQRGAAVVTAEQKAKLRAFYLARG